MSVRDMIYRIEDLKAQNQHLSYKANLARLKFDQADAELTTTAHALTIAVERCGKLEQALEEACQILENFGFPKAAERLRGVMK